MREMNKMACYMCADKNGCNRDCYYKVGGKCKLMEFQPCDEPVECDPSECECFYGTQEATED
jgi:hypothetical protein